MEEESRNEGQNSESRSLHLHGKGFGKYMFEARGDQGKLISSLIPNTVEVIVDIGCGTGFYSKYLLEHANRVYCIDVDEESLLEASESIKSERLICVNASGSNTNLPSNSVDIVFMANSFHDMEDKGAVVNEVERILVDGGKLIILDWKKDSTFGPPRSLKLSEADYIKYFNRFAIEKSFDVEPQHYCLIFSKSMKQQ